MENKLVIFKKNILAMIKEKLEIQKEKIQIRAFKRKWGYAIAEANKNSNIIKPIVMNKDEQKGNPLNIPYSTTHLDEVITKEQLLKNAHYYKKKKQEAHTKENKSIIKNSEELKEIYTKVKNNEIDLETLSATDLLKIYVVTNEELKLIEDKFDAEEDIEEEIKKLEEENETLRKEIEKLNKNFN